MNRFRFPLVLAVLAIFAACGKSDSSPAAAAGPTKEAAVQTLRSLQAALDAKDYDKAINFIQIPPDAKAEDIKAALARIPELQELSSQGIDILAEKGKWGKLTEVYGERGSRFAERMKVSAEDSYGLSYQSAEAGFYWDGKQFKLVRIDDIGKLR